MQTLFEHAGGQPALRRFIDAFYTSVLRDPVLKPLFGSGRPEHVDRLTAFDSESFGGPDDFSRSMGGFAHLVDVHRGLRISEPQRQRFVELYRAAADIAQLPTNAAFREALRSHVEFGSRVAMQNSHARNDEELHRCVPSHSGSGQASRDRTNVDHMTRATCWASPSRGVPLCRARQPVVTAAQPWTDGQFGWMLAATRPLVGMRLLAPGTASGPGGHSEPRPR